MAAKTTPNQLATELTRGLGFKKENRKDGLLSLFHRGERGVVQVIALRRQTTIYAKVEGKLPTGMEPSKQGRWDGRCSVGADDADRARAIVEQLVGKGAK